MPVSAYPGPNTHTGNGVTTLFAYSFRILDESDLKVTVDGVVKALTTHYTVAGEGDAGGGSITFLSAPAAAAAIIIERVRPYTRTTDYQRNGAFDEETVDKDFDSEEMQVQQLAAAIARAFKAPVEVTADQALTTAQWAARASKILGFDGSGNFSTLVPADLSLAAVSAFIATLLDDADAATARATLGALQNVLTTIGDSIIATTAGAAARLPAQADVAAHATTMNPWVAREIVLTGAGVTFTDVADAPYVGAVTWVKQNAAHVWTHGGSMTVQGAANYTAAAGDWVRIYATTIATFEVTVFKASGAAVAGGASAANQAELDAGTEASKFIPPSLKKLTVLPTQATTSGTTKDFTIPAGATLVAVPVVGMSTNGNSFPMIQLGDAGGPETSGYLHATTCISTAVTAAAAATAGFTITPVNSSAWVWRGLAIMVLVDPATFTWACLLMMYESATPLVSFGVGTKALSAELTTVRVTSITPDTFDLGLVGCAYLK